MTDITMKRKIRTGGGTKSYYKDGREVSYNKDRREDRHGMGKSKKWLGKCRKDEGNKIGYKEHGGNN